MRLPIDWFNNATKLNDWPLNNSRIFAGAQVQTVQMQQRTIKYMLFFCECVSSGRE